MTGRTTQRPADAAASSGDGAADGLRVTRLVDLSHPVRAGMRVYPGDPSVDVAPALTVDGDGVNVLRLHLGSQSGTHVDAPFHVRDDLERLDEIPLEVFTGPAVLVDVRDAPSRSELGAEVLDGVRDRLAPGVVVLLVTGRDAHWDEIDVHPGQGADDPYLAHPWPSVALAADLVAAGVRCLGVDALSVDRTPPPGEPADQPLRTHLVLAQAGCVVVENLRGLVPLLAAQANGAATRFSAFPLHLAGADGAPVRAVAAVEVASP